MSKTNEKVDIAVLQRDVIDIKDDVKEIKEHYVTREEFEPIKKLMYGLVSFMLVSTLGVASSAIVYFIRMGK